MRSLSFIVAAWLLITAGVTAQAADPADAPTNSSDQLKMLELFGDVFEKVKKDYVEPVTDKDLIEAALNGMLTSLDPHSSYLNEKAFDEMKVQTKGEFGGLGIEVTMDNGLIKVVSPIDDTPAFQAGIKAGDYISFINDDAVMGMTLNDAVSKMRGKIGTKVKLTVLREGVNDPLEFNLTRDTIKIKSVRGHAENDVGYVRITSFSEQTGSNLQTEIAALKKEIGPKLKGFVLDLRNNPGGLLDQAIAVSDTFLDHGEIVSTRGRIPDSTSRYDAHAGDLTNSLPLVVLINGGSASASEIVSGALQDNHRAIIMGTRSFGKGSVQTIIPLPDHGAMRLTTSRYYTPSGKSIQAEGIKPDIVVEAAKIELLETVKDAKKLYSEANLRKHLSASDSKKDEKATESEKASDDSAADLPKTANQPKNKEGMPAKQDKNARQTPAKTDEQALYDKDYQLARAVDLLRGIAIYKNIEAPAAAAVK